MTKDITDLKEKIEEVKKLNKIYRQTIRNIMKDNQLYNNKLCSVYQENTNLLKSRIELKNMIIWQNNLLDVLITSIAFLIVILVISIVL